MDRMAVRQPHILLPPVPPLANQRYFFLTEEIGLDMYRCAWAVDVLGEVCGCSSRYDTLPSLLWIIVTRKVASSLYVASKVHNMEQEFSKLQSRLQSAVDAMLGRVNAQFGRPIQRDGYMCSAKCFDSPSISDAQLDQCINHCNKRPKVMQATLQNEMNSFQTRLQRCSQNCQDEANDQLTPEIRGNPGHPQMANIERSMLNCSNTCVDKHIAMLPSIEAKIAAELKSK